MWWAYTRGGLYSGGLIVGGLRYCYNGHNYLFCFYIEVASICIKLI